MSGEKLRRFEKESYLSIESYRKNGSAVRTPVWFAESNGLLYVYSLAEAGKVKRIRNNPRVRVAPCDVRGKPKGDWVEARASIADKPTAERGHQLLNRKYPLKRVGDFFSKLRRRKQAVITIELE
jgi:PPOX class probable F420-dependent enzyme